MSVPASIPVAIARGDGIGPEIMDATLAVLAAARAPLEYREIEIGESVYRRGHTAGIAPETWSVLRETGVLLKAPITTPQGGGYKSLNVTLRKALGLFANVRPVRSYHPFVDTKHPNMDVVIIRENEEDVYAGIEHRQTEDVYQCLKLITRPGSERIIRYAFEYARHQGRRKVTCMTKDNIMKMTDGLFHKLFDEIGAEYPGIERNHLIVDIGMARIAEAPELFSVVVTPNLYGDIVSDIVAEISGSVGLAPSANIGEHFAMFEAIHGSAPDIAGKGIANPSGLLLSAVMMLAHLGLHEHADLVHNAWLKAIEDGQHTGDLYTPSRSRAKLGTREFAQAVIDRLGDKPERLPAQKYIGGRIDLHAIRTPAPPSKKLVGVDVFVAGRHDPNALGGRLQACVVAPFELQMITNRGVKVWPDGLPETFCTDHWRCRFIAPDNAAPTHRDILALLGRITDCGIEFIKTENLYFFDGKPGFSLGQGQ